MSHNPSHSSYYIDDAYYRDLTAQFSDWQRRELEIDDVGTRDACGRFLNLEARLLESDRHDDWLKLYAPECLYWVPAEPAGGDPKHSIAVAFDDRRRLEDRVFRLQNDYAWSQVPRSRTSRLIGNVTVFAATVGAVRTEGILMVRSNFVVTEFQAGDTRQYAGWCAHRLRRAHGDFEIIVKQVNLIDCDQNLRNPSITL